MRRFLIEWPATIIDAVWAGYWRLIAALTILCLVNAALALLLALLL